MVKSKDLSDPTSSSADGGESLADKLAREGQLFSQAAKGAASSTIQEIKQNPEHLAAQFAGSAIAGAALSLMQKRAGLAALSAEVIGASLTLPALLDGTKRVQAGFHAAQRTYESPLQFEQNKTQLAQAMGSLTTDFVVSSAGGLMGALGSRIGHPGKISKIIPAGESKAGLPAEAQQASTAVVPFKPAGPPEVAAVAPEKPPIFDFNTIEGHPDKKLVDLYWKAWPSIIQIETTRSKGNYFATGFIVSDKGHVATAFHAIADADRVVLSRADGGKVEAKLEAVDPGADLAIFKIDNTRMRRNPQTGRMEYRTEPTEALPLAAGDPSPGQSVVNLGYARNVENVGLASGKVSKIVDGTVQINGLPAPVHSDQAIIQTSVACRPGFSGGPLLNESGEVVGLHSAGNGVDRGFDIPTSAITSNLFDRELRKDPEFWRGIVPLIKSAQRSPQTTTRIEPDGGFASDLSNIYAGQHSQVFKIKAVRGKSKGSPTVKDAANSSTEEIELGTALKVTDQHHYVTSAKLVKGASAIRLNDNGIWSRDLEIAKILDDSQLAILRPVGSLYFGSRNPIQLSELLSNSRSMSTVKQGQTLVAIGYPQKQFELHAAVGQLSHFESANLSNPTNRSRRTASQSSLPVGNLNIPLDPGLEGAPIFNRKGELVGIGTTGPLGDKKESMISLPTRSLVEALREITAGKK